MKRSRSLTSEMTMAKKAASKSGVEAGNGISKAQAVRNALAEGLDSLDDIESFLKSRYGIEIARQQLSAYKSQAKAKEANSGEGKRVTARKSAQDGEVDVLDALEAMKPLVAALGVEKVKRLADLLGQ